MLTICAWCERDSLTLQLKAQQAILLGVPVSHGICDDHLKEIMDSQKSYAERMQDRCA